MSRVNGRHAVALLAGAAVAITVMTMPVGLIEVFVSSSGLSEILPAAAPPLGTFARVIIALFAALMASGAVWVSWRDTVNGERKMGFALSKLSALSRRYRPAAADLAVGSENTPAPVLRRADAHPDAPARQPIFASRDLGGETIFSRPLKIVEEGRGPIQEHEGLALPVAPAPLEEEEILAIAQEIRPSPVIACGDALDQEPSIVGLGQLGIAELTERLERGLSRRMASRQADIVAPTPPAVAPEPQAAAPKATAITLADLPAEAPVPIRPTVDNEVEDALRVALGTLQKLTARAG